MDIATLTAAQLLRLYRARKLSPVEVTKAVYDRIGALDPAHNAFCVLKPGHAAGESMARELQEHVKATIAPFKYPLEIEFVASLPRTETGKLQRFKLREPR